MRELLDETIRALDGGRACIHCLLVETRGSTPQKPGAGMLVHADGSQVGTLGGGCVEAEVKQRALRSLADGGEPAMLTFNLDDNYGWDDGLICGGRMTVLAEPLRPERPSTRIDFLRKMLDCVRQGRGCTQAVALAERPGVPAGAKILFGPGGECLATTWAGDMPTDIAEQLVGLSKRPGPSVRQGVAYLPLLPKVTLLIVGAGHVGQAVAKLGSEVDFDIWVLDDRESYASATRFPTAAKRWIGDIGSTLRRLVKNELTPSVYALIVTRGHGHDEEALFHLVESQASYVGMIGSRRKIRLIYEDLLAKGISAAALQRVHAPLGLNIGSQTVPEIAISIVSELIAVRNLGHSLPAARISVSLSEDKSCSSP